MFLIILKGLIVITKLVIYIYIYIYIVRSQYVLRRGAATSWICRLYPFLNISSSLPIEASRYRKEALLLKASALEG